MTEDSRTSRSGASAEAGRSADPADRTAVSFTAEIIDQAVETKATDIHLEIEEKGPKLRFRINGLLHDFPPPPTELYHNIVARIKVMSDLDVAERRVPQSGFATGLAAGRRVDMRVSTFPSVFGETIAIRVLDRANIELGFARLGFSAETAARYEGLLEMPFGIILVTGPTGGGKTTTLYASLNRLRNARKKIITLEDPVEYHIDGVVQGQINPRAGFTFAEGLRSILRQDPNVVMVGEIRDAETAATAMQIALTGQVVFATLHTNSAPGAVTRLLDMGLEPYLVSSALLGVINQTLVRHVCPDCRETCPPPPELLLRAGRDIEREVGAADFYRGRGCPACNRSGVRGRTGLYELMVLNQDIRELILRKPSVDEVAGAAMANGMITLRQDGLRKAAAGTALLEDVLRVTMRSDE